MTRVLHTADTHLGYRQYHSPERQADFLSAFRRVVSDAIEDDVDAVVHAGDLFHDRRPGLSELLGTLDVLETLSEASIPFLAVVGNHEAKRSAQWLDLFEATGLATRLGDDPVVIGDTAFYGLDFVPKSRRDDLEYEFTPHDADHAALVSHGRFEPLVPDFGTDEWDLEAVLESASVAFDAALLGDEHAPTTEDLGGTWATYPGSTERASSGEREDRGYNLVEFDGDVRISRRGIETRPFVFVDLELGEQEGIDRVHERLREHDLEDAVVHVTLEGEGAAVSPARIESFATEAGALVARVKDHREIESDDAEIEVSFADPDEAVRERLRELELSDAARNIDATVRSGSVADANVADEVEDRVEELLAAEGSFRSSGGDASGEDTSDENNPADAADTGAEPADGNGEKRTANTATHSEITDGTSTDGGDEEGDSIDGNGDTATDGQSSMEEYL